MANEITRVFIMRHGERMDYTFGDWLPFYNWAGPKQEDLNIPTQLPARANAPESWDKDCPLTNVGVFQARMVGEALRRNGYQIDKAFVSPAYRSVQTCSSVLEGLQQKDAVPLAVEAGVFEYLGWYKDAGKTSFQFMTNAEFKAGGFNVNEEYVPQMTYKDLENEISSESLEDYYKRNGVVMEKITADHAGKNILVVGHGSNLEVTHQRFCQIPIPDINGFHKMIKNTPYCSILGLERDLQKEGGEWRVIEENFSVTHTKNNRFDKSILKGEK